MGRVGSSRRFPTELNVGEIEAAHRLFGTERFIAVVVWEISIGDALLVGRLHLERAWMEVQTRN